MASPTKKTKFWPSEAKNVPTRIVGTFFCFDLNPQSELLAQVEDGVAVEFLLPLIDYKQNSYYGGDQQP